MSKSSPLPRTLLHAARAGRHPTAPSRVPKALSRISRPAAVALLLTPPAPLPFESPGRTRVRREQAAHPLRMGGHAGPHFGWLARSRCQVRVRLVRDLGSGKLRMKISSRVARVHLCAVRDRRRSRQGIKRASWGRTRPSSINHHKRSYNGGRGRRGYKDEGRVGIRSDNRPKHHKQPRRREGETWMGHGKGGLYSLKACVSRG